MTQAGFYSINQIDNSWELHYAPNFVTFSDGLTLLAEEHDQYTYPVNDWYWFESEEQAKLFFGVKD